MNPSKHTGLFLSLLLIVTVVSAKENELDVTLVTSTGELKGSLLMPSVEKPSLILMIAGSGPTDRNGNSPQAVNDSLKQLAQALATEGIATLRYDKRSIGASVKIPEAELLFKHYVNDAAQWIREYAEDKRFSELYVLGHSEGSLIGLAALQSEQQSVEGFISLAGAGRSAKAILTEQLKDKLSADLYSISLSLMEQVQAGEELTDVPESLYVLFRPTVVPYMHSWFQYQPTKLMEELNVPALVVQGTEDLQITLQDANLLHEAGQNSNLVVIDGMNHVLKTASGDLAAQYSSYITTTVPMHPELMPAIAVFVGQ